MRNDKKNLIVEMSTQFSLEIIEFCESLKEGNKRLLGNLLFRSGTSIGANIREAQNAESLKDFIHKFKIAAKEADESAYWLELCNKSELYPTSEKLEKDLESEDQQRVAMIQSMEREAVQLKNQWKQETQAFSRRGTRLPLFSGTHETLDNN